MTVVSGFLSVFFWFLFQILKSKLNSKYILILESGTYFAVEREVTHRARTAEHMDIHTTQIHIHIIQYNLCETESPLNRKMYLAVD